MRIEIMFVSISDEHFAREPSITIPRLKMERFCELVQKGVFGEHAEVSMSPFRSSVSGDNRKIVGLLYTVKANDIGNDNNYFLKHILSEEVPGLMM